jgi:colicin import membrane protein
MQRSRFVVVGIALAAAACGHGGGPKVREGDFARLEPAQTEKVNAVRAELAQAEEDLARAKARVPEARREVDAGDADRKVAETALDRAKKELDAAEARRRAADARKDYAEKLAEAREADVDGAQRRVDLANARVELAKLLALEQAGSPNLAQYEKSSFYESVTNAQKKVEEAQTRSRKLDEESRAGYRKYEDLNRKVPAGQ